MAAKKKATRALGPNRTRARSTPRAKKRRPPRPNHSDARIVEALSAWLRSGRSKQAEAETGIPASSIRNWRETRPDLWRQVTAEHEAQLRDLRAAIATTTADGLRLGAAEIRRRLDEAQVAGLEPKDLSSLIRALAEIDGTQDRIRRLDAGTPTERVALDTDADVVAALSSIMAELGK